MRWLADFFYLVAGVLYLPVVLYQAIVLGKNRRGWRERFGGVRRFPAGRTRIWVHAVSLGEVNCTPMLVEGLRRALPDVDVVISTTTDTGFARAVQLYGRDQVFRFPLDFSAVIAAVLRRVKPAMIVLIELEVWYNLVHLASQAGIPVVVANGRLTARSAKRLQLIGAAARSMFRRLAWVGAQDEAIANRFKALGVTDDRVEVTSSMKWDTAEVTDRVDGQEALARALGISPSRPLLVCGSTGPGEEALLITAFQRLLLQHGGADEERESAERCSADGARPMLVLVPRKPERFGEVARLIERCGLPFIRRSEHGDDSPVAETSGVDVILGDTMGELRKFYALADVIVLGRTFVPMGGSDPMEAAALKKTIIVGPHHDNFREPVDILRAADAIRVVPDAAALANGLRALLQDPQGTILREQLAARAQQVVLQQKGATGRTIEQIVSLIPRAASGERKAAAAIGTVEERGDLVARGRG